jgi:hypothetical protein
MSTLNIYSRFENIIGADKKQVTKPVAHVFRGQNQHRA